MNRTPRELERKAFKSEFSETLSLSWLMFMKRGNREELVNASSVVRIGSDTSQHLQAVSCYEFLLHKRSRNWTFVMDVLIGYAPA